MKLELKDVVQGVIVGVLLAILSAVVSTYVEVKMLRNDVDRIEVYVDQLWKQK